MTQQASVDLQEPKRPRRWWIWTRRTILTLFTLLVVLVILGCSYLAWANHRGEVAMAAAMNQLRHRQLPTSREGLLSASPATTRPAGRHLDAAAELKAGQEGIYRDTLPVIGEVKMPDFGQPIPADMATRLARFVEANKVYFALLDQAQASNERQELLSFGPESMERPSQLRGAAKYRLLASLNAQAAGKGDEAMGNIAGMLWLGSTFDGQPSVMTALVRGATDSLAVSGLGECLGRMQAGPQSLQDVRKALLAEEASIDFRQIVKGELAALAEDMTNANMPFLATNTFLLVKFQQEREQSGNILAANLKALNAAIPADADMVDPEVSSNGVRGALAALWTWAYLCPGANRQGCAAKIDVALGDLDQATKPTQELAKWAAQKTENQSVQGAISPRGVEMLLNIKAALRVAAVAMSVEAYQMEHGDWPADLAAVKDGQLHDPFTGQPLKYARTAQGVTVYSVGKNLLDDGGKDYKAGGDDLVFKLLNKELRNRP